MAVDGVSGNSNSLINTDTDVYTYRNGIEDFDESGQALNQATTDAVTARIGEDVENANTAAMYKNEAADRYIQNTAASDSLIGTYAQDADGNVVQTSSGNLFGAAFDESSGLTPFETANAYTADGEKAAILYETHAGNEEAYAGAANYANTQIFENEAAVPRLEDLPANAEYTPLETEVTPSGSMTAGDNFLQLQGNDFQIMSRDTSLYAQAAAEGTFTPTDQELQSFAQNKIEMEDDIKLGEEMVAGYNTAIADNQAIIDQIATNPYSEDTAALLGGQDPYEALATYQANGETITAERDSLQASVDGNQGVVNNLALIDGVDERATSLRTELSENGLEVAGDGTIVEAEETATETEGTTAA
jgi:hypothetical protein